jgi:hypothetical protein
VSTNQKIFIWGKWGNFYFICVIVYSMNALREQTTKEDLELKKKVMAEGPQASYGYGGKFGVQGDRLVFVRNCYCKLCNFCFVS